MPLSPTSAAVSRRDVLKGLVAAGVGTATGAAAHGFFYERHHVDVTRAMLRVSELPESLAGLKVGFMTDLHRSDTVSHDLIATAASLLMNERPDLIILGGDYVTWGGDRSVSGDRHFVEPAAESVRTLSAPHGVFGVLGNHDDDRDMPAAMAARGIEILRDERTRLTIRGEPLDLIGIRYWTTRSRDIASVARGASARPRFSSRTHPSRLKEAAALVRAADAERSHPWRADRATRGRRPRRAEFPHRGWRRTRADRTDRVREPRGRHGLRADPDQLPPRGGSADPPTGNIGLKMRVA